MDADGLKRRIIRKSSDLMRYLNLDEKDELLKEFGIHADIYAEVNENLEDYAGARTGDGSIQPDGDFSEVNVSFGELDGGVGNERGYRIEVQMNDLSDSGGGLCHRVLVPVRIREVRDCLVLSYHIFLDDSGKDVRTQFLNIEML